MLFINLVRTWLGDAGITPHLGWAGTVAVTFVLTIGSAALFTALMLRTPLRWVLTGPVRAEQRARLGPETLSPAQPVDADASSTVPPVREPARCDRVDARARDAGALTPRPMAASDGAEAKTQR